MFFLLTMILAFTRAMMEKKYFYRILYLEVVSSSTMGYLFLFTNAYSLSEMFFPTVVVIVGDSCVGVSLLMTQLKTFGNDKISSLVVTE
nr:NADH dehydrogenase subunit 4l [Physella acuta]CAH2593452.1 NADH dehydrogenase subunit 4l [Physella acuta]CAH2593473.1 NADH dehydrogenase subunit 4l [Physella acuta]CAH2593674.1 NADH dehydrogenase subunit 4l [Physella acuta]CAH2593733.1 NADH dehydrogenase subunit 4l [Physella acuta]